VWRFAGLRPANHPIRRLALLAHWLARDDLPARLEQWLQIDCPKTKLAPTLNETLAVQPESFWKHHWTFRSPRQPKPSRHQRHPPVVPRPRRRRRKPNNAIPHRHPLRRLAPRAG